MARKKKRRSYGSGCILSVGGNLAIRWREPVLQADGSIKRVLKYETLGPVSMRQATQKLRDRQSTTQALRRAPLTFQELAAAWKTTVLPMYKFSTRKHHADILEKKILPYFGAMRIDQINRQHVQQFIAEHNARGYSPNTIDHYHNVLSTVLTKAVEWSYILSNPASGVELPKLVSIRPKTILTPEQAQQLLARLNVQVKTLITLAIMTGVRRGELFALRWKGFDTLKSTLFVQEAVYENVIDRPKTEKSIRVIPLPLPAVQLLRQWKDLAPRSGPEDFIFARRAGGPRCHKQVMRDHVTPACKALGFAGVSWLTFRRTFATWADQNGVTAKQRGELMGNSAEVNAHVYTQVMDHPLRLAMERVGSELFSDCSVGTGLVN